MTIFFTSDTHFGHENIIHTCHRPFATVDEMDETLVARWNARVAPDDTVYHLGDVCFRNAKSADEYLDRLHGTIHLVVGNHDTDMLKTSSARFASITLINEIVVHKQRIVLCHYPMREWNGAFVNAWHLFGHVHGRLEEQPHGYSLDVGADVHDFAPVSFDDVARLMKHRVNPFISRRRADKSNRTGI